MCLHHSSEYTFCDIFVWRWAVRFFYCKIRALAQKTQGTLLERICISCVLQYIQEMFQFLLQKVITKLFTQSQKTQRRWYPWGKTSVDWSPSDTLWKTHLSSIHNRSCVNQLITLLQENLELIALIAGSGFCWLRCCIPRMLTFTTVAVCVRQREQAGL